MAMPKSKTWNTEQLAPRISSDLLSGLCASTLVAPLVTLIDKSIIVRTHNPEPLLTIFTSNLKSAVRRPFAFFVSAPFILINTLYFATYSTANLIDTVAATVKNKSPSTTTAGTAKFLGVGAVNMSLCMFKDARFAKLFGAGAAKSAKTVPMATLALFAGRDSMTIFTSFNAPPLLGPIIGSVALAQFLAPASIQLLSTPLHLLGLDLYNRPRGAENPNLKLGDRWAVVRRDWFHASLGRIGRIVPAYGLGGVVNTGMRKRLMRSLE